MLLGSTNPRQQNGNEEALIIQLMTQKRYAEAYILLKNESPGEPSTQYNLALCHYSAGNYQEALICLDNALRALSPGNYPGKAPADQFYHVIRQMQNQTNDHLEGITKKYVTLFRDLVLDHVIRLQTDCWLKSGNFPKVVEIAKPLERKNYKNITEALQLATK